MSKRKVQTIIFYCDSERKKHFLLLKMNERRGLFWQNVTGGVEKSEKFKEAALREAIEETGLKEKNLKKLQSINYQFEFHDQWGNDVVEKVYSLEVFKSWEIVLDPSEHIDYKWVSENQITTDSVKFESNYHALQKVMNQ